MPMYFVFHERPDEYITVIGIFSSKEKVDAIIKTLKTKPQFATGKFTADDYVVDKDYSSIVFAKAIDISEE